MAGPRDLLRLCAHLKMRPAAFTAKYAYMQDGKIKIRTGHDDYCVFFEAGIGCRVHEAKPDICRAWPFFRGNMLDAVSLRMAGEFCPGIDPAVEHADFVCEGSRYLDAYNLRASDPVREAGALFRVLP